MNVQRWHRDVYDQMDGMDAGVMDGLDKEVLGRLSEAEALHRLGLLVVLQCLGVTVSPAGQRHGVN